MAEGWLRARLSAGVAVEAWPPEEQRRGGPRVAG
jgi:hypothetical protein